MTIEQALGSAILLGVAVIGYFLKGLVAQQKQEVETSRRNERELYAKIGSETEARLKMHIEILKDQLTESRRVK